MHKHVSNPIVVAVLAGLLGYTWAQRPVAEGDEDDGTPAFPAAVVDLGRIFKGYRQFTEKQAEIQQENQKADETAKSMVAEAQKLQEELKGFKPGSPDHQRIVEELQARNKEFENFKRKFQQKLNEEHTQLLVATYDRVVEHIQQYAEAKGIKLVLKHQAGSPDVKNLQQSVEHLSRPIVFHNLLDMTDDILQSLN